MTRETGHDSSAGRWEQRWHPLRREWVVVAAHRQQRPWRGETASFEVPPAPAYDPECHFCPGNLRIGGDRNPRYATTLVFDNDHPCVGPGAPAVEAPEGGPLRRRAATGLARVVCYSPRHDLSLAQLGVEDVDGLLAVWQEQFRELGALPEVRHVLVFENRGEAVGVSNPHPHCQIYATNFVFRTIEVELEASAHHLEETHRVLLQDVLCEEERDGRRLVCARPTAVAFVPHFARWSYEVFVMPRATHADLTTLSGDERRDLAAVLLEVTVRYDNLWRRPFPYVMALHQAPTDGRSHPGFHFHVEFHPPLRAPDLRKFPAGPEMGGGNFISDTCAEDVAAELRAVPGRHFSEGTPS